MLKALTVGIVGLCALCALPTIAMAGKKIDSHVAWTDIDPEAGDDDPILLGEVTSDSPKCVKGRKIKVTDDTDASVTTTADNDGVFGLTSEELFEDLPGIHFDTVALKKKFGPKGKKKTCNPDTATLDFEVPFSRSISDFALTTPPNTFTGTLVSEAPICVGGVPVTVYYSTDGNPPFEPQETVVTEEDGGFSYTHSGSPQPGSWDAFAINLFLFDFEDDGDVLVGQCASADSNDVVIPARRAFDFGPSKHPEGPVVIREVP